MARLRTNVLKWGNKYDGPVGDRDTITGSIENLTGTVSDDTLSGDGSNNVIDGAQVVTAKGNEEIEGVETVEAWKVAMERREGPTMLVLTRQKLPALERAIDGSAEGVRHGAYVLGWWAATISATQSPVPTGTVDLVMTTAGWVMAWASSRTAA